MICTQCGAVQEIQEDLLGEVERKVERDWSFKVKDRRLTFHGICKIVKKMKRMKNNLFLFI